MINDRIFKAYATRKDNKCVAFGMTDGEAYWLVNLDGVRISEWLSNKAQVTIEARYAFGPLWSGDARTSIFPGEVFDRADWSF